MIQHNTAYYSTTQHNTAVPVYYVVEKFLYVYGHQKQYIFRGRALNVVALQDSRMMMLMMTTKTNLKATPKNIPVSLILRRFLAFIL
jgi:hypothetical protein